MKRLSTYLKKAKKQACQRMITAAIEAKSVLRGQEGQGTTEYAILVGVLVVIAIVAIVAFRGVIENLWNSITDAINSLG